MDAAAPGARPRRSAAARREQRDRAMSRAVQLFVKGFEALDSHRGCRSSRMGHALYRALRAEPPCDADYWYCWTCRRNGWPCGCRSGGDAEGPGGGFEEGGDEHVAEVTQCEVPSSLPGPRAELNGAHGNKSLLEDQGDTRRSFAWVFKKDATAVPDNCDATAVVRGEGKVMDDGKGKGKDEKGHDSEADTELVMDNSRSTATDSGTMRQDQLLSNNKIYSFTKDIVLHYGDVFDKMRTSGDSASAADGCSAGITEAIDDVERFIVGGKDDHGKIIMAVDELATNAEQLTHLKDCYVAMRQECERLHRLDGAFSVALERINGLGHAIDLSVRRLPT